MLNFYPIFKFFFHIAFLIGSNECGPAPPPPPSSNVTTSKMITQTSVVTTSTTNHITLQQKQIVINQARKTHNNLFTFIQTSIFIPSFRPRFAGNFDRQSRDLTQLTRDYSFAFKTTTNHTQIMFEYD